MLFSISIDIVFVLLALLFIFRLPFIAFASDVCNCQTLRFFLTLVGAVVKDNEFCSMLTVSPRPVSCSYNLLPETCFATFM